MSREKNHQRATDSAPKRPASPAWAADELVAAKLQLLDVVDDVAMLLLDPSGHVMTWNHAAQRLKGWRAEEIIGRHFSVFYTPEAQAVDHPTRELELAGMTGMFTEDGWRVRRDGSRFWARVKIYALRRSDGSLKAYGKVTRDLTAERQNQEQLANVHRVLEQTIRIDRLTGLSNRLAWDEKIDLAMANADKSGLPLVVALLDLDHFKVYNDTHGHQAGDLLLQRAAIGWRAALRSDDLLARYGGEEFLVGLPGCDLDQAQALLGRLMAGTPDGCTFSSGIALWNGQEDGTQIIDRADRALYRAKEDGRACLRIA